MTFETALANRKLIYSVLLRAGIDQTHPDFEDYVQDCLLIYITLEEKFAHKLPTDPVSREAFIFVRMYCQIIDHLRHEKYRTTYQMPCAILPDNCASTNVDHALICLRHELKQRLTAKEYQFFEMAYRCELPFTYICHELKISRRTAYRFQKIIRQTTRQLGWEKGPN